MKFGGQILEKWTSSDNWADIAVGKGYSAVYFPVDYTADIKTIDAYKKAANDRDLIIAEIGVWDNLLSSDSDQRKKALEKSIKQIELADYVEAKCCVNIAGSYSSQWDGPCKENYTQKALNEIVEISQKIIDESKPKNTFYAIEPMPWMYPDSIESYLELIELIDREHFGVHLDPVNIITHPRLYYSNADFLKDCFNRLGKYIKSIHAKDIILSGNLTVHLSECRPGLGELDYETFLMCANELDNDTPFMLEHISEASECDKAIMYVKEIAEKVSVSLS